MNLEIARSEGFDFPLPAVGQGNGPYSADVLVMGQWLAIYRPRSPNTFRTYFKEGKRWLAWLEWRLGSTQSSHLQVASEDDVQAYLLALGRPADKRGSEDQPFQPTVLPGHLLAKYRLTGQPFLKEHHPRSMAHALSSVSALYKFLGKAIDSGSEAYVRHNPTSRLSRLMGHRTHKVSRHFSPRVYAEMLVTVEIAKLEATNKEKLLRAARRRWIIVMLYGLWIRLAEASSIKMSSFKKHHNLWTLTVVGKGRKERSFEVTSGVIMELSQYRMHNELPSLLAVMEDKPAILPIRPSKARSPNKPCTATSIYREVKLVAEATAARLERDGTDLPLDEHEQLIESIRNISPHWFRHSGASEAINADYPIRDAADRLGHASINTTSQMYHHADSRKRRDALERIEDNRAKEPGEFYL